MAFEHFMLGGVLEFILVNLTNSVVPADFVLRAACVMIHQRFHPLKLSLVTKYIVLLISIIWGLFPYNDRINFSTIHMPVQPFCDH